jgi:vacuolar-type H+-ATPase catalytic subunit A/Vma1
MEKTYFQVLNEEILTEGIQFFKVSNKLHNLANTISKRVEYMEDKKARQELIDTINKIEKLSKKFKAIENSYAENKYMGNKELLPEIKKKYQEAISQYKDIMVLMGKDSMKKNLKTIHSYAFMLASMVLPFTIFNQLSKAGKIPANIMGATTFKDILKRSGILVALGLPISAARSITAKKLDSTNDGDVADATVKKFKKYDF